MDKKEDKPPRRIGVIDIAGELFLTVGAILLLFVFYESYWTNIDAARQQKEVEQELEKSWDTPEANSDQDTEIANPRRRHLPEVGEAFARMYIPVFGSDYQFAIVEGTQEEDLLKGPGRYVSSQMPGEPGNFAVAGHRVGKGAPFNDLGNLKPCDAVVVETRTNWDIYRIMPIDAEGEIRREQAEQCLNPVQVERIVNGDYAQVNGRHITVPGDVSVLDPIPEDDRSVVDENLEPVMTMTTCHPQFSNKERMILHAMWVRSEPKVPGVLPVEMES